MSEKKFGSLFARKKGEPQPAADIPAQKDVKKRWLWVGIGAAGFVLLASTLFGGGSREPLPTRVTTPPAINTTPKGLDAASWQVQSQKELEEIQRETSALRQEIQRLRDEAARREREREAAAKEAASQPPPGVVAPPQPGQPAPQTQVPPAPPVPVVVPPASPPGPSSDAGELPPIPSLAGPSQSGRLVFKPKTKGQGADVAAKVAYKKNPNAGLLPPNAFAPVALLNGLDASASNAAQSNPQPVLMNIQDHATLPGASKYALKNCFVLGSGYGDLSAERVYIRLVQLSCVDKRDQLVLTAKVEGYLVDSDGTLGLRGKIADRKGRQLAYATMAQFAQGLAGALGSAQSTVTSSALGAVTSISGGDALRASGLSGAKGAAEQLAQVYLREAQNIFPVIAIESGRVGTIVFTSGAKLEWGEHAGDYVKQVTPE